MDSQGIPQLEAITGSEIRGTDRRTADQVKWVGYYGSEFHPYSVRLAYYCTIHESCFRGFFSRSFREPSVPKHCRHAVSRGEIERGYGKISV